MSSNKLLANLPNGVQGRGRSDSTSPSIAASSSTGSSASGSTLVASTSVSDGCNDEPETSYSFDDSDVGIETESLYTLCSQNSASDTTMSDLPGAGRTLGLLYSRWGRALESSVGKLAYKRGYGPDAVAEQIKRVTFGGSLRRAAGGEVADEVNMVDWYVAGGEEAKLRSACQKLARYAESNSQQVRMRTLERMIYLITMQPRFRPFFQDPDILQRLQRAAESKSITKNRSSEWEFELELYQEVTFLAKQALFCIEDNPLNGIIDSLLQHPFLNRGRHAFLLRASSSLLQLLELCKNSKYSYIARRHMQHVLDYLPWYCVGSWDAEQFWSPFTAFLSTCVAEAAISDDGRSNIECTEALVIVLLLPRCRALHAEYGIPRTRRKVYCRCSMNEETVKEMSSMLELLKSSHARELFPRAAVIVDEIWSASPV